MRISTLFKQAFLVTLVLLSSAHALDQAPEVQLLDGAPRLSNSFFAQLCAQGDWQRIEHGLSRGYRPNQTAVFQIFRNDARLNSINACFIGCMLSLSGQIFSQTLIDGAHNTTHIAPETFGTQLCISGLCGLIYGIKAQIESVLMPHVGRITLDRAMRWVHQHDEAVHQTLHIILNNPVIHIERQQPRTFGYVVLPDTSDEDSSDSSDDDSDVDDDAILDTGMFDRESGLYQPNFMSQKSYILCCRARIRSRCGFAFKRPGKVVHSLDTYLFGSPNPFTREQRAFIDPEKCSLTDSITLEPLCTNHDDVQHLCRRFGVSLDEAELNQCRRPTQPTRYLLPQLAALITKKR